MTTDNIRYKKLKVGCKATVLRILMAFLILIPATTVLSGTLTTRYTKERPVIVICDWDKPPYEFLNDKGQPSGLNIDIMKAIMEELNLPVRFVMKEWGNALRTFERGDADIIMANVRRYRREPYVASENIINYDRIKVATRAEDSISCVSQKMLVEGRAVFKSSDYAARYFINQDSLRASKIEFQLPKVALTGIVAGDNKYFVWYENALKWKVKELNLEGITLCDVNIPISEIHVIGRNKQLIDEIDDHYSRLKQNGEVERMSNRWFHPELAKDDTPYSAVYTVIGILILITLFYLFYRLSKAKVLKATSDITDLSNMMSKALQMGNFIVMEYDIKADRVTNRYGTLLPADGITMEQFISHLRPNEQQDFRHKMERMISGRDRSSELEKHWRTDNGEWLSLHGHAMLELDNDGHPAYIINAVHNETLDVQEEIKYHTLLSKYECLFNIPLIATAAYDKDGWLMFCNDPMKRICGFNNGDNERYWKSLCMFDIPLLRNIYTKDNRDDLIACQHLEYAELDIDRYIMFHIHPVVNNEGEVTNYFCSALDITDEHDRFHQIYEQEKRILLTNKQINKLEKQLNYLLTGGKMYVWQSDRATRTVQFTRSLRKPEFTDTYDDFLSRMDEDMRQKTLDTWEEETPSEQIYSMTYHFNRTHYNDQQLWCHSVGMPVRDAEGNFTGHFGIISDITDLMEAQLLLRKEMERAEDSGNQKNLFLASMTHEIRTPLNSIIGFTGLLNSVSSQDDKREFIKIIRTNCDMLVKLINDILEMSSISDSPRAIIAADVDFAKAFDDIYQALEQRVLSAGLTFIKDNPYSTFPTHLDISRIRQVITNFVANAVKYTHQGHIKVGYRSMDGAPETAAGHTSASHDEQHGLYIYCEDTGAGIPKDKQEEIFERFIKLNEYIQGTGLGLTICKAITERCGGRIGVESEGLNSGSTFWIWIPCERKITPHANQ